MAWNDALEPSSYLDSEICVRLKEEIGSEQNPNHDVGDTMGNDLDVSYG